MDLKQGHSAGYSFLTNNALNVPTNNAPNEDADPGVM